jgi:hypothetical protein
MFYKAESEETLQNFLFIFYYHLLLLFLFFLGLNFKVLCFK